MASTRRPTYRPPAPESPLAPEEPDKDPGDAEGRAAGSHHGVQECACRGPGAPGSGAEAGPESSGEAGSGQPDAAG